MTMNYFLFFAACCCESHHHAKMSTRDEVLLVFIMSLPVLAGVFVIFKFVLPMSRSPRKPDDKKSA
jgi:hypothetical protein